ncbi:hypothetical protein AB1Y20_008655 [Prymnesium parvum]|uniref:Reverse transcriptase Ty1/copia-type domain-containing protein n=1 Tax=Prymnesium parvum TaxID=97485 RepID=A0AB34IS52_PRYPA
MLGREPGEGRARAPPGYRRFDARGVQYVWRLKVPLYGEADAVYIWNRTLVDQLVGVQGFVQSQHDPCLFLKQLADGSSIDVCVHVDDGFVTDSGSPLADAEMDTLNAAFRDKYGADGVVLKEPKHFLGQNIVVHSPTRVTISSRAYVTQLAAKYLPAPLAEYAKCTTPCLKGMVEAYEEAVTRSDLLDSAGTQAYASKTGAAIFAGSASRCDALYALGMCARCLTFPTAAMDACVNRVIAYLANTADQGVTYDGSRPNAMVYEAYSDSDWCVAHSTTGAVHCVGGRVISASSKRQVSIALSSTEAEIMAASLAGAEIMYLRGVLRDLAYDVSEPTVLWVDNSGAVELTKRRESAVRSRHIERRYLKIREWVAEGHIVAKYKPTADNHADMFTKPLPPDVFFYHRSELMGA